MADLSGPANLRKHSKPRSKVANPVEEAIRLWFNELQEGSLTYLFSKQELLFSRVPKRWTSYPPMILLPAGSFDSYWDSILETLAPEQRVRLWQLILTAISKREGKASFTHLAINAGIPLNKKDDASEESENILRTPGSLVMLYGNFGPALSPNSLPTQQDFDDAFWVSTKQNGITQIWAPRYTMFSRGNIKEKARLLKFHEGAQSLSQYQHAEKRRACMAVDLYAGIGYFVFSYVKMGMGKVIGWELNPWSVEGLRRGALANGWDVRIVNHKEELARPNETIIIFQEDNQMATQRFGTLRSKDFLSRPVLHINCGLLPTSLPVWKSTLALLDGEGWLHLHENVAANDIEKRSLEITRMFEEWMDRKNAKRRRAQVEHVELVKTFAPGVWHCVFDLFVSETHSQEQVE